MTEAHVDVKITSGYFLYSVMVLLKQSNNQIWKTSYIQQLQVHQIWKMMTEIMTQEVYTNNLKELVNKMIPNSIGKNIEKACKSIYHLCDVSCRKVHAAEAQVRAGTWWWRQ